MASDMVVALAATTVDGQTLFGHNYNGPGDRTLKLVRSQGQKFTAGEAVKLGRLEFLQVRRTASVLAGREEGAWGYEHGVNEHGVAIGCAHVPMRLQGEANGLSGADLVRLGLERAQDAPHAVELLMDLICRHGHVDSNANAGTALLIVDNDEAFILIAAGKHWALQNVGSVRSW